jgi:L-iditol 2-dehydrogenase
MVAFTYQEGGKLELREASFPRLEGEDGAVLKVQAASICGTDLRTFRFGSHKIRPPRIVGHEVCGILEQVGAAVEGFREGERVVVAPAIGCGECPSCRRGATNMCDRLQTLGFEFDGAFAGSMVIPDQAFRMGNVLKVAETIPSEQAALAEPVGCVLNGQSFLGIGPEDSVVVFGAGFIGCMHAELALRAGATRVVVVDVSQDRLEVVGSLLHGVERVNSTKQDILRWIADWTGGRGADVLITANPDGRTHGIAAQAAAKRGRISLFGGVAGNAGASLDSNAIHYKELSVYGSHATTPRRIGTVLQWLESGELELGKYISGTYPLERIREAFDSFKDERVLKLVIQP